MRKEWLSDMSFKTYQINLRSINQVLPDGLKIY